MRDPLMLGRWLPQQLAAKLACMHPDGPARRISHTTVESVSLS
ncbi:transposase [Xanthomonas hortorum pv. gardneri]|nr:transposase [Xanthomonas hortorum pv. gardneri]APP86768.1 transposase [Xanthomonas hortorum pv. gardneri]